MENQTKKFLIDDMLGTIAKKLRLMGFDSKYLQNLSDEEKFGIIQNENRILVTKDTKLVNKAKKITSNIVFVSKSEEVSQFLELKNKLNLENLQINPNISRCTLCNGDLIKINKNKIEDNIPKNVSKYNEDFWRCISCSKIYWNGTHITNLQKFVRSVNEKQ